MRNSSGSWSVVPFVLAASVALAGSSADQGVIRAVHVMDLPTETTHNIYVSGQVVTVLRFDQAVDVARTKFLGGWEGRFEPLLVGRNKVIIEPIHDLSHDERVPLLVTLADGTGLPFLARPPLSKRETNWEGWTDHQVNVFKDRDTFHAVLSALDESVKRERVLTEQVERFKKEENSVDHAYATLLANGQWRKTPFRPKKVVRPKAEDMDMVVELFTGPGKAATVVTLTNTFHGSQWSFENAYLTRDFTLATAQPFALRMERPKLAPGQSGRIAVVVDKSAFVQEGHLVDLALQIFRDDGLLQVAVALEHTLVGQ